MKKEANEWSERGGYKNEQAFCELWISNFAKQKLGHPGTNT